MEHDPISTSLAILLQGYSIPLRGMTSAESSTGLHAVVNGLVHEFLEMLGDGEARSFKDPGHSNLSSKWFAFS